MASSSSAAGDNAPVSTKGYAYMAGFCLFIFVWLCNGESVECSQDGDNNRPLARVQMNSQFFAINRLQSLGLCGSFVWSFV
jgi:hypothetical protein